MKIKKRKEIIFHKIKVNKNNSNNRFNNSQNNFNIKDKYKFSLDTNTPNITNVYSYYQNYKNAPYVIIKNYKLNSSSEEKLLRNKKINNLNNNQYYQEVNNYIQPKINYTKSLLNNENSERKIINLRDINNNNNMRNKRNIYRRIFDSDNLEYNKSKNFSIKSGNFNDNNNNIYKNKEFKTIENNNINNYINEFKLINNYYENNRNKNNYNIRTFDDKYIYNNSLDNSSESNIKKNTIRRIYNNQRKTHQDYLIDYNNDKNKKFNSNYQNIFSIRNTINESNNSNYYFSHLYNNSYKNLNQKNIINEKIDYSSVYIKRKSPYRKKEHIIDGYNNKGDNYKKLFNIYRGKLIQEFIKHLKKAINLYLLKVLKGIIFLIKNNDDFNNNYIHQNRKNHSSKNNCNFKKINSLPKIKINKYFDREINISKENNLNKIDNKRYTKIFYSEKKYQDETNFKKNLTSRNKSDIKPTNIYQIIKNTKNNQINNKDTNKIISNNELIKIIEKSPISKLNYSQNREIKRMNSLNNKCDKNIIYKKKIKMIKYNALNIKKLENKNNPINISNSNKISNKIIDIDINLGKPIKEISDISLLKNFENNKNLIKKFDKTKKHSKRSKTRRKYSLPKKKYLEEIYEEKYNEEQNLSFPYKTYSYDCKKPRINNLVNKNNERLICNEKNEEKFFVTNDKLLSIRLNYLFSLINNDTNMSKSYNKNILKIIKNENFFLFKENKKSNFNEKNKNIYILSLTELNNSRNSNDLSLIEKNNSNQTYFANINNNKYLLSCIKFMIKAINKFLLGKEFAHFKKCI